MADRIHYPRRDLVLFNIVASVVLAATIFSTASWAQETVVALDPAQTKIEFTLSDILHTVHGTFALKSSTIRFDPSTGTITGAVLVDATSGDSGNGSRDRKMHREILESAKFPEIIFTPKRITGAFAAAGASKMEVTGAFRLHGQDHDVTLPVDVTAEGQKLQIAAHLIIPYVQWGLKNPSNFLLRVSDKVAIDIHATALLQNAAAPR
jgi:polyisoprenoid-binding protein YceI